MAEGGKRGQGPSRSGPQKRYPPVSEVVDLTGEQYQDIPPLETVLRHRERARGWVALSLVAILGFLLGTLAISAVAGWITGSTVEKLAATLVGPVVGLVGPVIGWYFAKN